MSVSLELLNSTFADFKKPLTLGFAQSIPLWAALERKAKVRTNDGGTYIERSIGTGGAGRGTGQFGGDEPLNINRRKKIKKYQVEPHLVVVTASIPKKELARNTGKAAVLKLIDEYPKSTMMGAALDINKYLLTGVSAGMVVDTAELLGFSTLNGQFTSGVGVGVTNGLLDFQAPASQTDTVQNVAKLQADYHFNQYGDITAWATNGIQQLKKQYRLAAHYSEKPGHGPDLIVMDDDTFGNYENAKANNVRIQLSDDRTEGEMISNILGNGMVYSDPSLDLALFTGVANDGVTYMLNTDFIEVVCYEMFEMSDFDDVSGDSWAVVAHAPLHMGLIIKKFPAQAAVSGGAS
jgi:hypothetical protein